MSNGNYYNESDAYLLWQQGLFYYGVGDYVNAIKLYENAIRLRPDYFSAYDSLGITYRTMGNYNESLKNHQIALNIAKTKFGVNSLKHSAALNSLGMLYKHMGIFKEAENYYLDSLRIRRTYQYESPRFVGETLNNLGVLYRVMGNYESAKNCYLETREIYKFDFKTSPENDYKLLFNLATLYMELGDYTMAEAYFLDVIKFEENYFESDHPEHATTLNNMGSLFLDMAKYDLAKEYITKAKNIREIKLGKKHPYYATSLSNLGSYYQHIGNYGKAEKYYTEAEDIYKESAINDLPGYCTILKNIGDFYFFMGNYEASSDYFFKAINIIARTMGKGNLEFVSALISLGTICSEEGDYVSSYNFFNEAKNILEGNQLIENKFYTGVLGNLAALYQKTGEYKKAINLFNYVMEIKKNRDGQHHPDFAVTINNIGSLYLEKGKYYLAKNYFTEFINIIENKLGKDHPYYLQAICNMDALYSLKNNYTEAIKYKKIANALYKKSISSNFSFLSSQQRSYYWKNIKYFYDTNYSFSYLKNNSEMNKINFNNILFSKGLLLKTNIEIKTTLNESDNSLIKKNITDLESLKTQIITLQLSGGSDAYIIDLQNKAEIIEKFLTRDSTYFKESKNIFNVEWKDIQDKLQNNEAVIEFVSYRLFNKKWTNTVQYAAMILKSNMEAPVWINICNENDIKNILSGLNNLPSQDSANTLYTKLSKKLYKTIWKPIEKYLKNIDTVFYSPSGLFHKINFYALSNKHGKNLIDIYNLILISSSRELINRQFNDNIIPSTAVVYGNLNYDAAINREANIEDQGSNNNNDTRKLNKNFYDRLEFSRQESIHISNELSSKNIDTKIFNGINGDKVSFAELNNKKTGIIHLATHGFYEEDQKENINDINFKGQVNIKKKIQRDPLMKSGLVLSGGNNNGIVYSSEIAEMNLLGTELVVLSACETGLGDIENSEGIFGLQRAFKLAGTKTLIMSLWSVNDKFTSEFMINFYKNWLNGMGKREAFRDTVLNMRKEYSEPYFWAAFVMLD